MLTAIKTALAAAAILALATPAFSYEQSESPENNGRNIQQVQPGPTMPLTQQVLQVRPARAAPQSSRMIEEQIFQRASVNLW